MPARRFLLLALFLSASFFGACRPWATTSTPADRFTGSWVMTVEGLPFTLISLNVKDGVVTGSVSGPENWSTSDGLSFVEVGPGNITRPITSASIGGDTVRFILKDAKDPTDENEFELTLTDADRGSLKYVGAPFAPWPLSRSHGDVTLPMTWDVQRTYALERPTLVPSAEMAAIFDADQQARKTTDIATLPWETIAKDDSVRRRNTRALLDGGKLQAGVDYRKAAFIFQHGEHPDDFLMAHTLALVALAKGDTEARWIAAVSLDRYLDSVGKAQIYTGSFEVKAGEVRQKPFNTTLISDDLRSALGVPAVAQQLDQFKAATRKTTK